MDCDTGKTCLGGCMHCPSASSCNCIQLIHTVLLSVELKFAIR